MTGWQVPKRHHRYMCEVAVTTESNFWWRIVFVLIIIIERWLRNAHSYTGTRVGPIIPKSQRPKQVSDDVLFPSSWSVGPWALLRQSTDPVIQRRSLVPESIRILTWHLNFKVCMVRLILGLFVGRQLLLSLEWKNGACTVGGKPSPRLNYYLSLGESLPEAPGYEYSIPGYL